MSSLKDLANKFVTTPNYPLGSKNRIKGFIENDKRKIDFLQNIKQFRKENPKLNFLELGRAIELNTYGAKGNRNFMNKFKGLVDFLNNPQDLSGLKMMTRALQDIGEDTYENFDPSRFEEFSKEPKVIYVIPSEKKTEVKEVGTGEVAAVSTEGIKEVVSPKIRGGSAAKEMKEAEEAKARDPSRVEDITERVAKMEKAEEIEREKKEQTEKLAKTKVDSMGNTFETEDDPRVVEPPIMSPDERDESIEDLSKSMSEQAIKDAMGNIKANQPPPPTATQAQTQTQTQTQSQPQAQSQATQTQSQSTQTEKLDTESPTGKVGETEIKDIPQDVLAIPKERASAKGKSEEQLINDIEYFFKTYPEMLDKEKIQFNKIQRGKSPALRKKQLMELHRRIVGKIGNVEDDRENKRIGIILNANKYLDNKINAILLQKLTEGLTPSSLVVDVSDKTKTDSSKRVGSYQITKGRSGLLNAQKAPIYRSIPTSNDSQMRKSKRPIKLKTLPTQRWDEVNAAKKQVRLDPFIEENARPNRFDIYL